MKQSHNKHLLLLIVFLFMTSFNADGFFSFSRLKEKLSQPNQVKKITRACALIQRNYYDPGRIDPQKMLEGGLHALANRIPEMIVSFPNPRARSFKLELDRDVIEFTYPPLRKLFDILEPTTKVFNFLAEKYSGEVDVDDQEYTFIAGLLNSLDPHSNILTPKIYEEFKTQTSGEYGGIGIVIGVKDEELTVISTLEEGPAIKAGLKSDDKIREIDGQPTINMPVNDAVEKLRGQVNTTVNLLIGRKQTNDFNVELTREQIVIKSVKAKLVERNSQRVGVIALRSFQEESYGELIRALEGFTQNAPLDAIILDMRNNPGGLLDQAIEIADKFLKDGTVVLTVGADNAEESATKATIGNDLTDPKMVVLINEGSASASEIVAGALKNNNRAVILGANSFGKGSVQTLFNLRDGAALKLTIAQYLTPGRVSIQAVGIMPDILLTPTSVDNATINIVPDEAIGEKNLDDHLENIELTRQEKPFYTLSYLVESTESEESSYTMNIKPETDYFLNLAVNLVTKVKNRNRTDMLPEMALLLDQEMTTQESKIVAALGKNNIDWTESATGTDEKPLLHFSSSFKLKGSETPIQELNAGDEVILTIEGRNDGSQTIERLVGVISAEAHLFKEKELVLGRISPSETKTATLPIKIPEDMINYEETIGITFYTKKQHEVARLEVPTKLVAAAKTSLSYSYEIIDNGSYDSKGNGNALPEQGENIILAIDVNNQSSFPTQAIDINLVNKEGGHIYLSKGRATIDNIPPNSSKQALLAFTVNPNITKDIMEIDLSIVEKKRRTSLADTLKLPTTVAQKTAFDPLPSNRQEPPRVRITDKKMLSPDSLQISGIVTDDQLVKDLMIYSGTKKVFYQVAPRKGNTKQTTFSAKVPLEKGANFISIQARDNRKLVGQENIAVMGEKKTNMAKTSGLNHPQL